MRSMVDVWASMVYVMGSMVDVIWSMVAGRWSMIYVRSSMVDSIPPSPVQGYEEGKEMRAHTT